MNFKKQGEIYNEVKTYPVTLTVFDVDELKGSALRDRLNAHEKRYFKDEVLDGIKDINWENKKTNFEKNSLGFECIGIPKAKKMLEKYFKNISYIRNDEISSFFLSKWTGAFIL